MNLDRIYTLPKWRDDDSGQQEGDEWKYAAGIAAAKAMYEKWREVYTLVMVFSDTLHNADDTQDEKYPMMRPIRQFIIENAMIVAPKIMGVAYCNLYALKMENASIIRLNCRQLNEQIMAAVLFSRADETHRKILLEEMDEFRELFKQWVGTFQKDDYEDEWGLYN